MYLGISAYNHESAAAIVSNDGILLDFSREETLSRVKCDRSFPKRSINKLLRDCHCTFDDISKVIFYERPLSSYLHPLVVAAKHFPASRALIANQLRNFTLSSTRVYSDVLSLDSRLQGKLIYCDHHLAHTLNALTYSAKQSNVCSIVVDGFGDRSTASISLIHSPSDVLELWCLQYPCSLGLFYTAITDYLGFAVNEGEYKVMGLAAYGNFSESYSKLFNQLLFWNDSLKTVCCDLKFFNYHISPLISYSELLADSLGPSRNHFETLDPSSAEFQRYADIAFAAQSTLENVLVSIFEYAYSLCQTNHFVFSGGVAMNSASLRRLASLPFVDSIVVPPSPGDAGSSIGAAMYGFIRASLPSAHSSLSLVTPSLFPTRSDQSHQHDALSLLLERHFYRLADDLESSLLLLSRLIREDHIIGIVYGDSETGPRALGHRSLICNGQSHTAVQRLNSLIKKRSLFRPTAPAMKHETAQSHYVLHQELMPVYSSMSATALANSDFAKSLPTTHVDQTARLQIVENGSLLDKILDNLRLYNISIIANSSLNLSGDPTCGDLVDGLMVCARSPLRYLLTDFGLYQKRAD